MLEHIRSAEEPEIGISYIHDGGTTSTASRCREVERQGNPDPGWKSGKGTNTYLIGQCHERILIDTGEGRPSWTENLKAALKNENATIKTVLLTHWHRDHVGGVPDLLKICPDAKIHKSQPDAEGQFDIEDGQIFQVDGATLRAYSTPGHTKDHMVFRLCEEDALFTGDNILGHGTSVFEDLEVYLSTLEKMKYYFSGRAYPGHGAVIADGSLKINEYIKHRQQREDEVLQVLVYGSLTAERDGPSSPVNGDELRRWTPMELVKVIYRDVPVTLHVPASQGVFQILKKLEWEGKVVTGENDGEDRFMIVL
ncbi:metallo-beta-lactamase domain-containing protein [Histoplasma capsulatum G186AR]|uniref:Lactamase-like protein nscB n=1 Tax=Ajellomyces capsulatus (strain G186AR / H82 / ATCC MYA-2454 / RMSCC 2432) TaxID=447093 RepID=C0NVL5_AJECG|nr:metallo-beta-lactamase domain-containing protein [Histoplasma capsulatum G186AR]EEH04554.1 metallo-beta-lactamase domain-containing protein [Histoplasma capsulatum G186AR]